MEKQNESPSLKDRLIREYEKPQNKSLRNAATSNELIAKLKGKHIEKQSGWGSFRLSTLLTQ